MIKLTLFTGALMIQVLFILFKYSSAFTEMTPWSAWSSTMICVVVAPVVNDGLVTERRFGKVRYELVPGE